MLTNLGSIGAAAVGGITSLIGGERANQANVAAARDTNEFNLQSAREQMEFQKEMSNTAYQRSVADLQKAGLNPLFAVPGGASTPGGASASGATPTVENTLGKAISSAMEVQSMVNQVRKQAEEIKLLKSQNDNVQMDTVVKSKGVPEAELKNDIYDLARPIVKKLKQASMANSVDNWMEDRKIKEIDRLNEEIRQERLRNLGKPIMQRR